MSANPSPVLPPKRASLPLEPLRSEKAPPIRWKLNAVLFFLTVLTTFAAGALNAGLGPKGAIGLGIDLGWVALFPLLLYAGLPLQEVFLGGLPYAGTLLTILLFHEFGHYLFARKHKVEASLPYFIPMPISFIGTMGAVIRMSGRIPTRNALMDIGAAGPLGGLLIAIPAMVIGVSLSPVLTLSGSYFQEGNTLLYAAIKFFWHGVIPAGSDVQLHPMAFAAWFGFFMTAMNLLPIGQLDGGHITSALVPSYHHKISLFFHWALLLSPLVLYWFAGFDGLVWGFFALVIRILMKGIGPEHPPVERAEPLSLGRKAIGALSMVFFLLLMTPIPMRQVEGKAPASAAASQRAASQP